MSIIKQSFGKVQDVVIAQFGKGTIEVVFVHESENKKQELDFYLPSYDVYIEVNKFHSDIIAKDNVIVIQGVKAVELFETILMQCTISPF